MHLAAEVHDTLRRHRYFPHTMNSPRLLTVLALFVTFTSAQAAPEIIRTARSGAWSDAKTWEKNQVPPAGATVLIRPFHDVTYDIASTAPIRSLHIGGTLTFATDRDTRLDAGLIKIQPGEDTSEEGFNCDAHLPEPDPTKPKPALLVGTQEQPEIGRAHV